MKYLHYWHFAKQWYCFVNETPIHSKIPSGNEENDYAYKCKEEYLVEGSVGLTHHQIKEKLVELYPNCELIKEIAYHEGARWKGYKRGSRNK